MTGRDIENRGDARSARAALAARDGTDAEGRVRALRLVEPPAGAAPAVVTLSPSLMRMSALGRLAIAAVLVALVWGATLAVTG